MDIIMAKDNEHTPIIDELLSQNVISQEQVAEAEATMAQNLADGQDALAGVRYVFDSEAYTLKAMEYPSGSLKFETKLPEPEGKTRIKNDQWDASGTHVTLFHTETCKKVEDIPWSLGAEMAFVHSKQGIFWDHSLLKESNLPLGHTWFYAATPKTELQSLPVDMYFSRSKTTLVLADRGAGTLSIVSLEDGALKHTLHHREPGNEKALNVALSDTFAYVTDGSTSITAYDLETGESQKISPGAGLLGNLIYVDDSLFLLTTKPSPGLKVWDLNEKTLSKDISIKGDLYSVHSDAPTDLMALSPDESQLIFMTYLNNPDPFTPVISVVDVAKRKTTARFAIKDGTRPALLTFSGLNPLAEKNQSVIELLLDSGAITDEELRDARIAARQKALEAAEREATAAAEVSSESMIDMEQMAFEKMQEEAEEVEEEAEEGEEGEEKFKPEKAPQKNYSPAADQLIAEHCMNLIFKQSQGRYDMQSDPELSEAVERLKAASGRARNELEWHNGAIIKLKELIGEMNFETVIMREEVDIMLHKHERDSLVKDGLKTVPSNCPNCAKPLFGSYICSYCGYEIERPEELLKRGIISIKTIAPLDNLPKGHFLLIDIEGKRLMEIDEERNIFWTIGKDVLSGADIELEFPRDAVRLATRNTLITDYSKNMVVEITPSGRRFWEFNQGKSSDHLLKNPVRATANGLNYILIVDQGNHRILEVDKDSDIRFQYGEQGKSGIEDGLLNMPADVQRLANGNLLITDMGNHRVLELEDREVVWQYGNPDDNPSGGYGSEEGLLCYPQSAFRLDNGHTLIVDTGNLRVIELNTDDEIVWEYKTNEGAEEHQLDSPFRTAYLPDGKIMILSENAILEVNRSTKEVVWACQMSQFEKAQVKVKVEQKTKRFVKHGVKNPYLKYKEKEQDDDKDMSDKVQALIAKRLSASRKVNTNKAHISTYGKAELEPFMFYMVERNKNRILQVDREGKIAWRYGEAEGQSLLKPHSCTKTPEGTLLVADTDHHRVIELNTDTLEVIWEFGVKGIAKEGQEGLNRPRFAQRLANQNILMVDQNNRRVLELSPDKEVVWEFEGMDNLMAPYHAEKLDNGNYLISDWGAHVVFEITPEGENVWQYGERKKQGSDNQLISYPEYATRLDNGNTLIVDTRNHRVIEVTPDKETTWELSGNDAIKFGTPTYVRRFANGHTLLLHSSNRQMLEVDAQNTLLWKLMLPFERPAIARPKSSS